MPQEPFRILMVAGEASGDLHGGPLARALLARHPEIELEGVGGRHMAEAGVSLVQDIQGLGAMGVFEMLRTLWRHGGLYRQLRARLRSRRYQAAILINYPAFNLLLAGLCRRVGCPVLFYIGPQIWASRPGRLRRIRRTVNRMYVVLPFEEPLYREAGVPVAYYGHPFVDLVRPRMTQEEFRKKLHLKPGVPAIGIFPGSRQSEIRFLLKDMLRAAVLIRQELGPCRFLIPVADGIDPEPIRAQARSLPVEVDVLTGGANYEVMQASDFLILASGSATLEAALFERPMVIVYRVHAWSYALFSWLVRVRWFGLVNIVAGREVVPELLNEAVTPERIAEEALRVLRDPEHARVLKEQLHQVRETLGSPGVIERIAGDMARTLELTTGRPNETASC